MEPNKGADHTLLETKMSYVLTLDEPSSKKLEELAEKERLPASKLIERAVMGYLGSIGESHDPLGGADARLDSNVASHKDLYGWDEEKGTVRFLPSDRRAFIMNAHAWDALEESLFLVLEKDAARILSVMGHAFGRMIALDYRSVTDEPENIKSYFEYLSLAAGWGKFSVLGDLQNGSKITVRVMNCVFCTSRNASVGRKNPCCFLMGVCKGTADTFFNFSHDVQETKCCAKGNDFCEVVLSRESHSGSGMADWSWGEHPSPIAARS
jgi:predicted hydrocarbon binding protein